MLFLSLRHIVLTSNLSIFFFSTFMSLNPRAIFLFAFLLSGLSIRTFRQIYRNIETSYSHGRSGSNVAAAGGSQ